MPGRKAAKDERMWWAPWRMERKPGNTSLLLVYWEIAQKFRVAAVTHSQKKNALNIGLQIPRCAMLITKIVLVPCSTHCLG